MVWANSMGLGRPRRGSDIAQNYGIADPDSFPWSEAANIYSAREGSGALPLSPTPDRAGRTVRVGGVVTINDVAKKKSWIDAVGPMAVMCDPWADFGGYSGGVYMPTTTALLGEHCLLVRRFQR